MNAYNLLSMLDLAVREQLRKVDKLKYVNPDTNFTALLVKAVNRYCHMYKDEQAVYDVAIEAFEQLFLVNVSKLKYFSGRYGDAKINIEQYLYKLYCNEIIDASKAKAQAYKAKQTITEMEGESAEEAFNRVTMGTKGNRLSMGDIYEIDYLETQLMELTVRKESILSGLIKVRNLEASVEKIDKDLAKMEKTLKTLKKEGQIFNNDIDDGSFTDEDQTEYKHLLSLVKSKLPKDKNLPRVILELMSEGYRQSEIAEYLEISKVRVSKVVSSIKQAVYDVSLEEKDKGFVYLSNIWSLYTAESNNSSNAKLDDDVPINLNRQIHRTFGRDLQDDLRSELYHD